MIKAVFFDLDGTLIDSERAFLKGDSLAAAALGQQLPPLHFAPLLGANDDIEREFLAPLVENDFGSFKRQVRAYVDAWFRTNPHIAMPTATATLTALAENGFGLGVVTSSAMPHLALALRQAGWEHRFDWLFPYVGGPAKPDPAPYRQALAQAGLAAAEVLAVEDTPLGVAAANAAGMPTAQIVDLAPASDLATVRLNQLAELPGWLQQNA